MARGTAADMEPPAVANQRPVDQDTRQQDRPSTILSNQPKDPQPERKVYHGPIRLLDSSADSAAGAFVQHSSGLRTNTDVVIAEKLRKAYSGLTLTAVPAPTVDLLAYAAAGHAEAIPQEDKASALGLDHSWYQYLAPARRSNTIAGIVSKELLFGKFLYRWKPAEGRTEHEFIVYIVNGRDGMMQYPQVVVHYILSAPDKKHVVNELITACGYWLQELRGEIWMFDQGYWQKSAALWQSIEKASWENVILDESMKKGIRNDVEGFFDSHDSYSKLKVPWKRGIIFYGPPGNGKTISIKAMMNTLYHRKPDFIPTLYVRSFKSFFGPENSIRIIFAQARQQAPCYLVFEDLDSLVTDDVRSYFLNEVDGLKSNNGVLMLGSTNHLDRLDPGIAKRPSRFDRKYLFPNPDSTQREAYCRFWQKKLADNDDVEFPDKLCPAIADITAGFSFAYMQEAFVASLLAIARDQETEMDGKENGNNDPLDKYVLWREIKKQIEALREGLEDEKQNPAAKEQRSEGEWSII